MSAIMQTNRWRQPGRSESGLPDTRRRKFELRSGVRPRREDQSVWAASISATRVPPGPLHGLQEDRRVEAVAEGAEVRQVVGRGSPAATPGRVRSWRFRAPNR